MDTEVVAPGYCRKYSNFIRSNVLTHFNDPKDSFCLLSARWRHHLKHHKKLMLQLCFGGMLQLPNKDTNQSFCLCASLALHKKQAARIKWIWGLLIALHKRSLALWRNLSCELNLKWIQIMFFAATRRAMLDFSSLCLSLKIAVCDVGREN